MEQNGKYHTLARWLNGAKIEELVRTSSYWSNQINPAINGERQFLVRGAEGCSLFLAEQDRRSAFENRSLSLSRGDSYEQFCGNNCIRGDDMFTRAEELLRKDREVHRKFFIGVVENGYVAPEEFNKIAQPYLGEKLSFVYVGDPYHLNLCFNTPFNCTFQEYIERHYIVEPCLQTADTMFEMMRICPKCGDFFVAKIKKAIFCSPSCRVSYQRKHDKTE